MYLQRNLGFDPTSVISSSTISASKLTGTGSGLIPSCGTNTRNNNIISTYLSDPRLKQVDESKIS
jgi:hypothetical protein